MIKYYTKKPIPVAALFWDGTDSYEMLTAMDAFLQSVPIDFEADYVPMSSVSTDLTGELTVLYLYTLEGTMTSYNPCYIIRGVRNEFYICEREIFEETYEEVNV